MGGGQLFESYNNNKEYSVRDLSWAQALQTRDRVVRRVTRTGTASGWCHGLARSQKDVDHVMSAFAARATNSDHHARGPILSANPWQKYKHAQERCFRGLGRPGPCGIFGAVSVSEGGRIPRPAEHPLDQQGRVLPPYSTASQCKAAVAGHIMFAHGRLHGQQHAGVEYLHLTNYHILKARNALRPNTHTNVARRGPYKDGLDAKGRANVML